jgi:hypothetical protein
VLEYAQANQLNVINVNQGYTKCSICVVNENAIITDDESIFAAAGNFFNDTLFVSKGSIRLNGYDYGFIGGASAVYKDNVFFFGDLKMHSQGNEISEFCKLNGFFPISLGKEKLCDVGEAIILQPLN